MRKETVGTALAANDKWMIIEMGRLSTVFVGVPNDWIEDVLN